jgi:4-amino-4-deoxy-L-arabinose transferase-like glycosyltransferase
MSLKEFFKQPKVQWLALVLFSAVILSVNVWSDGIFSAQEGRAAIVARQMLHNGNWLHLDIEGAHNTEKPVMCYWFYALSGAVFGVNEFSVRLPSMLAALATVLMAASLGMRIYGRQAGLLAGFMLASMAGFVNLGRLARIDMVLCAFYTASMYLLYVGYFEKMKANRKLYLFYLVLALSVMVKGPVSVALVGLTVILLVLKERNWKILWELKPISGLLIGLAICAPWYAYEIVRTDGAFFYDFFLKQNVSRLTGVNMTYRGGKRGSYFYYFPKLFVDTLPWSLLLPFGLWTLRKKFKKFKMPDFKPATWYLLIWFLTVFVFFSVAAIKRGDYVLPLYAPAAILLGRYLSMVIAGEGKLSKKWRIGFVVFAAIAAIAMAVIGSGLLGTVGQMVVDDKIEWISKRDGMNMVQISNLITANLVHCCIAVVLLLGVIFALGKMLENGKRQAVMNTVLIMVLAFFCAFYIWIDPTQNRFKTVKYFCERSRQHVKPDETVCYYVEWITEAVFFMNRDYDRYSGVDEIYDSKTGKMKYKFIITEPDAYEQLPPEVKNKLVKLEETIPKHQYPHVLLKAKEQ